MRKDKVVYKLVVEDIQDVASELLERNLTDEEIALVTDKVGDFIPWYDAIENAIERSKMK
jgi:hypothetical protein